MHTPAKTSLTPAAPTTVGRRHELGRGDLPLHCPLPGLPLWNAHPRVFLALSGAGSAVRCPYCGTEYVLRD